jgi:CheY-like chemotaxis protein
MNYTQSGYKIVLIDDDPICHLISEKMIKRFSSHSVEAFINALDALQQLSWRASNAPSELPDLILLDLDMPQMDGWDFLDEFNKLPENVAEKTSVFILSSSDHHNDKAKAKNYNVVRNFFSKPLTEEIVRSINTFKIDHDLNLQK